MENEKTELRSLFAVYAALLALLGLTFGVAYLNLGSFSVPAALMIATMKAALVMIFFMELRRVDGLHRVAALVGVFWLGILLTLALTDYLSRGWNEAPGAWPQHIRD